jgi:hypothetical protein
VRVIMSNEDAQRLEELLQEATDPPEIEFTPPTVEIRVMGETFSGTARRTPSRSGSLVVEDMDGHAVLVAD